MSVDSAQARCGRDREVVLAIGRVEETDPDTFLGRLRHDLLHHVGGHLNDDAAMIVIERTATPRA